MGHWHNNEGIACKIGRNVPPPPFRNLTTSNSKSPGISTSSTSYTTLVLNMKLPLSSWNRHLPRQTNLTKVQGWSFEHDLKSGRYMLYSENTREMEVWLHKEARP